MKTFTCCSLLVFIVMLASPVAQAGVVPKFREVVVDANSFEPYCVRAADINGNGRPDLVAVGRASRNVKLYLNTGQM